MSHHETNVIPFPSQKPSKKIRLKHIFEVFSEFSKGDVDAGESTVRHLNIAQIRNHRDIISQSLKSTGRRSQFFVTLTNEVDPDIYDKTVGMTQRSEDGGTFVTTDVVTNNQGGKELFSLAFTIKLRDEVGAMLGQPQTEENKIYPQPEDLDPAA